MTVLVVTSCGGNSEGQGAASDHYSHLITYFENKLLLLMMIGTVGISRQRPPLPILCICGAWRGGGRLIPAAAVGVRTWFCRWWRCCRHSHDCWEGLLVDPSPGGGGRSSIC